MQGQSRGNGGERMLVLLLRFEIWKEGGKEKKVSHASSLLRRSVHMICSLLS